METLKPKVGAYCSSFRLSFPRTASARRLSWTCCRAVIPTLSSFVTRAGTRTIFINPLCARRRSDHHDAPSQWEMASAQMIGGSGALWTLAAFALRHKAKGKHKANHRAASFAEAESLATVVCMVLGSNHQMRADASGTETPCQRKPAALRPMNAHCRQPFARAQRFRHSDSYLYSGAAFS